MDRWQRIFFLSVLFFPDFSLVSPILLVPWFHNLLVLEQTNAIISGIVGWVVR